MFFTEEKVQKRIDELVKYIYKEKIPIRNIKYYVGDVKKAETPYYDDFNWTQIEKGNLWGGYDVYAWFRGKVEIPENLINNKIALIIKLANPNIIVNDNFEALVYVNGNIVQGSDINHQEVILPQKIKDERKLIIAVKAWSTLRDEKHYFMGFDLVNIDDYTEDLYFSMKTAFETAKVLGTSTVVGTSIINILDKTCGFIDWRVPGSEAFYKSIEHALKYLKSSLDGISGSEIRPSVTCIGHSHIDIAWLWRFKHTREKAARTFYTVLNLMDHYPEYRYLQSQPQLYKFIKEDYPEIFENIKSMIKEGKWEAEGGMWVEADCNLISGESIIRQLLYGTRFFKEEFGVKNKILWLPDVFGYSWALPQILKKSGFKYFMTTKISWNQFNRPQYDTFIWRGIDGTEILSHFITTPAMDSAPFYTYNGDISPKSIMGVWANYREKEINNKELLISFGYGDGGGGPTKEMLETARRLKNMPGIPACNIGKALPFFERLEEQIKNNQHLPVWDGELYLEYHRGTYTSQAQNKKYNRKSEILYHDAEMFNTFANIINTNYRYPSEMLNKGWELILLNQFHDVLPGSSIHEVYEDSEKIYQDILNIGNKCKNNALDEIVSNINISGKAVIVFNSLSWERSDYVKIKLEDYDDVAIYDGNEKLEAQVIYENNEKYLLVYAKNVPSCGYKTLYIRIDNEKNNGLFKSSINVSKYFMENNFFKIKLNDAGQIEFIYDKINKRNVLNGTGNVFQAFEDKPLNYDAWDIDIFYKDKMYDINELIDVFVEEEGPERGTLHLKWKYMNSYIDQKIIIYDKIPRIDFDTTIDWHEEQTLLKVAFPVDIRATKATYEIQFGNVERPTHWNTSWDYARFETVGHKWVDLSQGDYGVSILNDCKYGHDIKDNVMRLTLIKSAISPDPAADKRLHKFLYSLYPHAENWYAGDTTREAYCVNYPLQYVLSDLNKGILDDRMPFIEVDAKNVIIETIKKAENNDYIVIRLYEYGNRRSNVILSFFTEIKEAYECDLMEEIKKPINFINNQIYFEINPYEIKTFMVKLRYSKLNEYLI